MQDMIVKAAFVGMNVKTGKTVMQFELDSKDIAMMPELAKAVGEVVTLDVHRAQGELPLDELMKPMYEPLPEWTAWVESLKDGGVVDRFAYDLIVHGGDMGPNGNVWNGVDEGTVLTGQLFSKFKADFKAEVEANGKEKLEPTCTDFGGEEGTNGEGYDFACSACGWCGDVPQPNYCPNCGTRVSQ